MGQGQIKEKCKYQTTVRHVAVYDSESFIINKNDEKWLDVFEMQCYCKMKKNGTEKKTL